MEASRLPTARSRLAILCWRHKLASATHTGLPARVAHESVCGRLVRLIVPFIAVEDLPVLISNARIAIKPAVTSVATAMPAIIPAIISSIISAIIVVIIAHRREFFQLPLLVLVLVIIVIVLVAAIIFLLILIEHGQAALELIKPTIFVRLGRRTWLRIVVAGWATIGHLPVLLLEVALHLIHLRRVQVLPIGLIHDFL